MNVVSDWCRAGACIAVILLLMPIVWWRSRNGIDILDNPGWGTPFVPLIAFLPAAVDEESSR